MVEKVKRLDKNLPETAADTSAETAPKTAVETPAEAVAETPVSIEKPKGSLLSRFKSNRREEVGKVEKQLTALNHMRPSDAKDFIRTHPDDAYWSDELCFVVVPVLGMKDSVLHLVDSELAKELPSGRVERFRLALAARPFDAPFFLAHIPSTNLDNIWNHTCIRACLEARTKWRMVVSKKSEGKEGYESEPTRAEKTGGLSPFPEPTWPKETLDQIIELSFEGKMILDRDHPAWRRLVGDRQQLS